MAKFYESNSPKEGIADSQLRSVSIIQKHATLLFLARAQSVNFHSIGNSILIKQAPRITKHDTQEL